jgi:hypothetical protein
MGRFGKDSAGGQCAPAAATTAFLTTAFLTTAEARKRRRKTTYNSRPILVVGPDEDSSVCRGVTPVGSWRSGGLIARQSHSAQAFVVGRVRTTLLALEALGRLD